MKKELRKKIGIKKLKQQGLTCRQIGEIIRDFKMKSITEPPQKIEKDNDIFDNIIYQPNENFMNNEFSNKTATAKGILLLASIGLINWGIACLDEKWIYGLITVVIGAGLIALREWTKK